jgi:transaldolase
MNRLRKLADYGQSYWMDDLSRDLLRGGDLPRRIRDEGLRGITSNPAIFAQAIGGSAAYDEQIARSARRSTRNSRARTFVTPAMHCCPSTARPTASMAS